MARAATGHAAMVKSPTPPPPHPTPISPPPPHPAPPLYLRIPAPHRTPPLAPHRIPPPHRLGGCIGALALHIGARLGAPLSPQHGAATPHHNDVSHRDPHSHCDWVGHAKVGLDGHASDTILELSHIPMIAPPLTDDGHVSFPPLSLPPLPRVIDWRRLQSFVDGQLQSLLEDTWRAKRRARREETRPIARRRLIGDVGAGVALGAGAAGILVTVAAFILTREKTVLRVSVIGASSDRTP